MKEMLLSAHPDPTPQSVMLVLGGQRSGKSAYAEGLLKDEKSLIYLATCEALDDEMKARVARHQNRRGAQWVTVEEPLELATALKNNDGTGSPILVDSLGMWVANLLGAGRNVEEATSALVKSISDLTSTLVIVSDEAGLGVIPDNQLARQFLDALGHVNQAVASIADRVTFIAAGLPVNLKG